MQWLRDYRFSHIFLKTVFHEAFPPPFLLFWVPTFLFFSYPFLFFLNSVCTHFCPVSESLLDPENCNSVIDHSCWIIAFTKKRLNKICSNRSSPRGLGRNSNERHEGEEKGHGWKKKKTDQLHCIVRTWIIRSTCSEHAAQSWGGEAVCDMLAFHQTHCTKGKRAERKTNNSWFENGGTLTCHMIF